MLAVDNRWLGRWNTHIRQNCARLIVKHFILNLNLFVDSYVFCIPNGQFIIYGLGGVRGGNLISEAAKNKCSPLEFFLVFFSF